MVSAKNALTHVFAKTNVVYVQYRSRIKWTLAEKVRMPHTVHISRVTEAGGDVTELERAIDASFVVLAPTLAVQQGVNNPAVK